MAVPKKKQPKEKTPSSREVDKRCPISSKASVVADWDAMLNQTNIGANNNKFYIIQLLEAAAGKFHVWTRWGRVGEGGQSALKGPYDMDKATVEFEKKFKSKTSNNWPDRADFKPKKGKYMLIEVEGEADEDIEAKLAAADKKRPKATTKASQLDKSLQSFIKLIFDKDTFTSAMADLDLDVKKMPLGQLSMKQVKMGFDALEELEEALDKSRPSQKVLADLSSQFYTIIPHSFGRKKPPVLGSKAELQAKMDMLNILADIEKALKMESSGKATSSNPLDKNYGTLKTDLDLVDPRSEEFKILDKYLDMTRGGSRHSIVDLFRVNRHGEGTRYAQHEKITNRRLLWHGTSVAVVAAILQSGLRIMPHSGGRVGKGIYLASEQAKSAGYTGRVGGTGIMFLTEAALGVEHTITRDNGSLKAAPKGTDCIIARGRTEPDPKKDINMQIDGHDVTVPQGKVINQPKFSGSSFWQSEYLVYKESQARIRYVLKMKM